MSDEWGKFALCDDFTVDGNWIRVLLTEERSHKVKVKAEPDSIQMKAMVARADRIHGMKDIAIHIWMRNRATALVGFRLDEKGNLIAESWIPKIGLTGQEFKLMVRSLAIEADRFEYALTGKDWE